MTSPTRPPAAPAPAARPAVVPPELVPERRGTVGFLSHVKRDGDWILPRHFRALAVLGNVELDLTGARLGAGTSEIEVVAILGNVTITVPPEMRVECDVAPLAGSFEVEPKAESTAAPDAPVVRITGSAYLASVEVKIAKARARPSPAGA